MMSRTYIKANVNDPALGECTGGFYLDQVSHVVGVPASGKVTQVALANGVKTYLNKPLDEVEMIFVAAVKKEIAVIDMLQDSSATLKVVQPQAPAAKPAKKGFLGGIFSRQ